MVPFALNNADRQAVSDAVAKAELSSDGEIVTVIARRSDEYHDAGLHWAIAAAFAMPALIGARPGWFAAIWNMVHGGWEDTPSPAGWMVMVFVAMVLIFLIVRYTLAIPALRMLCTPRTTRGRRVRRRAVMLFRTAVESRTRATTGVLIYVSVDERRAELVADAAINTKVAPEVWGEAMAALVEGVRSGQAGAGLVKAVELVGAVLAHHFPRSQDDSNELPDRLIEL